MSNSSQSIFNIALFLFASVILSTTLTACSEKKAAQNTSENSSIAQESPALSSGHQLFLANCVRCHAGTGNPPGPDALIIDSERLNSETSFNKLLRQPTSAMMRSFTPSELSNAQIHTLYEYVSKTRKPKS
jgi:mono/diheme cytochrome c family protein